MPQDYSHGYFGRCAVEGLLKTTLGYFGSTVVDERWKGHSGACGVEELVWATPGPLSGVEGLWGSVWAHFWLWKGCGGYSGITGKSGITLVEMLWQG